MYAANVGTFLQRDPLDQADGAVLEYTHTAVGWHMRNLYQYTDSNPLSFFDPFGLEKQVLCADGSVRSVPDNTDPNLACAGRGGPVNPGVPLPQVPPAGPAAPPPAVSPDGFYIVYEEAFDPTARRCKCLHTDIVQVQNGQGTEIRTGAGGKSRGNRMPKKNDKFLTQVKTGSLGYGVKAGNPCSIATPAQIASCISSFPTKSYLTPVYNCQSDVTDAANGCCLTPNSIVGPGQFWAHFFGGIGGEGW